MTPYPIGDHLRCESFPRAAVRLWTDAGGIPWKHGRRDHAVVCLYDPLAGKPVEITGMILDRAGNIVCEIVGTMQHDGSCVRLDICGARAVDDCAEQSR